MMTTICVPYFAIGGGGTLLLSPLCCYCNGAIANNCAGLFAIIAMALLPLLPRRFCNLCASIDALVALALLLLLRWRCCHCCSGNITSLRWHHHPLCHASFVPVVAMVPLPLHSFFCLCCTGVISIVALATLLWLCWHCCP
jgi:hypothetical protein